MHPRPRMRPGRSRRLVTVLLATCPFLELAGLILLGTRLGVLATLGLVLLGALIGLGILGTAGLRAMRALRDPVRAPTTPGAPAETTLLMLAGVLFVVPGLLSDAVGALLLVPAVRRALARRAGDAVLTRLRRAQGGVVLGQVVDPPDVQVPVEVRVISSGPAVPPRP